MKTDPHALPAKTMKFIDVKVTATPGLNDQDREDLRQNMYLAVIREREKFDPARHSSLEHFLESPAMSAWKKFFRDRARLKRARVVAVLDEPVRTGTGSDGLGVDTQAGTRLDFVADPNESRQDDADREIDRSSFKSTLADPMMRSAYEMLIDEVPQKEIIRRLGITEAKFRFSLMPALKRAMKKFFGR